MGTAITSARASVGFIAPPVRSFRAHGHQPTRHKDRRGPSILKWREPLACSSANFQLLVQAVPVHLHRDYLDA